MQGIFREKSMKRLTVLVAAALLAWGCGKPADGGATSAANGPAGAQGAAADTPTGDGKLQIVSPHPEIIQNELGPAFEAWYKAKTGKDVKVVWRDMGGTSDALRVVKGQFEQRPQGIGLDMFFGGGIDPYIAMKSLGILEPYKVADETLAAIPKDLNGVLLYDSEAFTWYGTVISGFGIIYNKPILKDQAGMESVATWEDLGSPKLFTWVGAGDPRHSGSVHMMYEIILQAYGWDKGWQVITAMGANARNFPQNAGDIPREVAAGHIAAGTAIDFYAWAQIDQVGADQVGFVLPEGLTVANPDSIAILKGAPNMDAAKAFIDFILSVDGQSLWYLKAGAPGGPKKESLLRMPIRPDVYALYAGQSPVRMNPFEWKKGFQYSSDTGSARWGVINDLVGASIIDSHDSLAAAWGAAVKAGKAADVLPQLAKPPVDEKGLAAIAEALKDPVKRNVTINEWVSYSRNKYDAVAQSLK